MCPMLHILIKNILLRDVCVDNWLLNINYISHLFGIIFKFHSFLYFNLLKLIVCVS